MHAPMCVTRCVHFSPLPTLRLGLVAVPTRLSRQDSSGFTASCVRGSAGVVRIWGRRRAGRAVPGRIRQDLSGWARTCVVPAALSRQDASGFVGSSGRGWWGSGGVVRIWAHSRGGRARFEGIRQDLSWALGFRAVGAVSRAIGFRLGQSQCRQARWGGRVSSADDTASKRCALCIAIARRPLALQPPWRQRVLYAWPLRGLVLAASPGSPALASAVCVVGCSLALWLLYMGGSVVVVVVVVIAGQSAPCAGQSAPCSA